MTDQMRKMKKRIMRRVYYTYALSLVLHPVALHGALIGASLVLMTRFVSFSNVFSNLVNIKVGNLGEYVLNSLLKTEIWTLLLIGIIVFAALSLRFKLLMPRMREASLVG